MGAQKYESVFTLSQQDFSEPQALLLRSRQQAAERHYRLVATSVAAIFATVVLFQFMTVRRLDAECRASSSPLDCDGQLCILWWTTFLQLATGMAVGTLELLGVLSELRLIVAVFLAIATVQLAWVAHDLIGQSNSEIFLADDLYWTGMNFIASAIVNVLMVLVVGSKPRAASELSSFEIPLVYADVSEDGNPAGKRSLSGYVLVPDTRTLSTASGNKVQSQDAV